MANEKQFDMSYVMTITLKNLHNDIDFSLRKTYDKFSEFVGNEKKKAEIFETLGVLNKLHALLEDFKDHNTHLFEKESN